MTASRLTGSNLFAFIAKILCLFGKDFSAVGDNQQSKDARHKETEICSSPGFLIQENHAAGNKYNHCNSEHDPGNDILLAGIFFQVL